MAKYQNHGQGTFTTIMAVVVFFLVIDVIITVFLICNIDVKKMLSGNTTSTTDNTVVQSVTTDNTSATDNE